jgi:tetratricopeptide (TPR) repeat protein
VATRRAGAESAQLLAASVSAFREALKVYTSEQFPENWARIQNNLGTALLRQGEQTSGAESTQLLAASVSALREALRVYTREQFPESWAMIQANLGGALVRLSDQASEIETVGLLAEAISAFQKALQVYTREHSPQGWALTQNNLGGALVQQSERAEGEERVRWLSQAIEAFRQALIVYTREHHPYDWAMTQNNLGAALVRRSEWSGGEESERLLGEAVVALHEALKVRTREQLPQQWATTQNNLGEAHFLLKNWQDAAVSYENALIFYPGDKQAYQSLASIYHDRLFAYEKALALHQKWLSRFPQDRSVLPDFAETYFTTGRFPEFSQGIKPLLADAALPASLKIALQMIEVANLLALDNADQVPATLAALHKNISDQKADFQITWSFSGTLHYIEQQNKFSPYRSWLSRFFSEVQGKNRDDILKAVREAQAQFPAPNSNQRK